MAPAWACSYSSNLTWEPPYALGVALEKAKRQKRKTKKETEQKISEKEKRIWGAVSRFREKDWNCRTTRGDR